MVMVLLKNVVNRRNFPNSNKVSIQILRIIKKLNTSNNTHIIYLHLIMFIILKVQEFDI